MTPPNVASSDLFAGPGEVCELCREKDSSGTPFGPVEEWGSTLRATVRSVLASPFPINLWCGPELNLIYNDAYRDVLGAKHPESLGRPGYEVWEEIWNEIEPMFERIRAGGPPVYAEDEPFFVERAGDADTAGEGEANAWFTFSLSPVRDEEGSIVAFLNIVSETTGRVRAEQQRKEARERAERAEARLLEVFERAPAFMAVLRGSGFVFEYANQAYYELVGARDLIGRPVFEALPEARDQGFEEILQEVVETGEPFVGREVPIELNSGPDTEIARRYLDFVYYPLEEVDGTVAGVVAHGYDVTEHVRARNEAEEASRAKSRFLGTMSHELRTPVNAILGYTELLEMEIPGPLNDAQRTQLERMRASTRHLLMLIGDVLDLARVEAGQVEVERRKVRMSDTVSDALSLVRPQAAEGELALEAVCLDPDSPRHLGDEEWVRQILVNLLSNAVKFTGPGGEIRVVFGTGPAPHALRDSGEEPAPAAEADTGSLEPGGSGSASSREDRDPGPMTFVRVEDTGVGIAPDRMEEIFRPFNQIEKGPAATRGGTGLGLAISRQLAEIMGGGITAESEVGEGSAFTFWLPCG